MKDNDCFKRHNHPIKAHPTYEYDIAQSQPLSPDELEHYEKKHNGPYKHIIGKLLHIQQWTRLDLNYAISLLAVYSKSPTPMAFQASDYLMIYLHHHMHEPIFYPSKSIGPDEAITYKWLKNQHLTYTTKLTYVYHIDAAFTNILPARKSM